MIFLDSYFDLYNKLQKQRDDIELQMKIIRTALVEEIKKDSDAYFLSNVCRNYYNSFDDTYKRCGIIKTVEDMLTCVSESVHSYPIKITSITVSSEPKCCWEINFVINNKKFSLIVPNVSELTEMSLHKETLGKFLIKHDGVIVSESYKLKNLNIDENYLLN